MKDYWADVETIAAFFPKAIRFVTYDGWEEDEPGRVRVCLWETRPTLQRFKRDGRTGAKTEMGWFWAGAKVSVNHSLFVSNPKNWRKSRIEICRNKDGSIKKVKFS